MISYNSLAKTALKSILKNKGRTILTSLGIIIGVTSVIMLMSIGSGLSSYVTEQFEKLGSNMIIVLPGNVISEEGQFQNDDRQTISGKKANLDLQDSRNIGKIDGISKVSPSLLFTQKTSYGTESIDALIYACSYQYADLTNTTPEEGFGRFFTFLEEEKNSKVAVIGYQASKDLFGNLNPLGKTFNIGTKKFKVVGVAPKVGGGGGGLGPDLDSQIYIPLSVGLDLADTTTLSSIYAKAIKKEDIPDLKKKIKDLLLEKYDEDSFSVTDQSQILSSINSILSVLTAGLSGIAAISLVVGGIGIMNIMLVTVSERTKEIGLRKALGATPQNILIQFLLESIILSLFGGAIGITLGTLGTLAINQFFPAKITLTSILISSSVAAAVGIIFGVTPARKAARLEPIEALRYE
jgi:putative ABC transport system permease protein